MIMWTLMTRMNSSIISFQTITMEKKAAMEIMSSNAFVRVSNIFGDCHYIVINQLIILKIIDIIS